MFDLATYQGLLAAVDVAVTAKDKGDTFEAVCRYLFGELDGVIIEGSDVDMAAEEIDIVLWNAKLEVILQPFEHTILVECKNWSAPAGAKVLDNFIAKLRRRTLKTGIFIAAHGVTGDFLNGQRGDGAVEIIKSALAEGFRIVVLNRPDLDAITSIDDFKVLIRRRYSGIFMHRPLN